ncbi:MAG: hypothetical protein U1F77_18905 [Kiritimatiellia bacterium]
MALQHASRNQTIWILLNASALMAAGAVVTVLHLLRIREPAWAGDPAYFASLALRFLVFALAFTAWWLAALRFFRPFERRDFGVWIFYLLVAEAAVLTGLVPRLHGVDAGALANAGTPGSPRSARCSRGIRRRDRAGPAGLQSSAPVVLETARAKPVG